MYCVLWVYDLAERLETQYPSSISCFEIIILYIFRLDTHIFFSRCNNRKCTREFCDMCSLHSLVCFHKRGIFLYIYWMPACACIQCIRILNSDIISIYRYMHRREFIGQVHQPSSPKIYKFFFYLLFWRDFFGVYTFFIKWVLQHFMEWMCNTQDCDCGEHNEEKKKNLIFFLFNAVFHLYSTLICTEWMLLGYVWTICVYDTRTCITTSVITEGN